MPVFFYIDPDFVDDPFLVNTNTITLSYTFFESKPGMKLPTYNPGMLVFFKKRAGGSYVICMVKGSSNFMWIATESDVFFKITKQNFFFIKLVT